MRAPFCSHPAPTTPPESPGTSSSPASANTSRSSAQTAAATSAFSFITEPGPIRKILAHLGEPLEPPPLAPARGPPADLGELAQAHDDRDVVQASSDELPMIDIHSR